MPGVNFYLTPDERRTIERARIGIAGAGGLGSNAAMHLVRAGIRQLVIADFDTVNASNLNRQFFFADQLGMPKVEALGANLRRIEPQLQLELHTRAVTAGNAAELFGACDILIEAFDRADAKQMLIQTMLGGGKPLIAASGIAGWGRSTAIGVTRIGGNLYLIGDGSSSIAIAPPQSARVGIAAAIQANTALALLLGQEI